MVIGIAQKFLRATIGMAQRFLHATVEMAQRFLHATFCIVGDKNFCPVFVNHMAQRFLRATYGIHPPIFGILATRRMEVVSSSSCNQGRSQATAR